MIYKHLLVYVAVTVVVLGVCAALGVFKPSAPCIAARPSWDDGYYGGDDPEPHHHNDPLKQK
jgi:hypothetical protein